METLYQSFTWDYPKHRLWKELKEQAGRLARLGVTQVWMPPAFKGAAGENDVGYGVYDLYDLGEFPSKGSIATRYGTKDEYVEAVCALRSVGIGVLADIVFNHRMGADKAEPAIATCMQEFDRNQTCSGPVNISSWTVFDFPARNGKYSTFTWNWQDFTATDLDALTGHRGIYLFSGRHWSNAVSKEQGNFDYIMGADVNVLSARVRRELYRWTRWYLDLVPVSGFRLDAIKSIDAHFIAAWLKMARRTLGYPCLAVGEYWSGNVRELIHYLQSVGKSMRLFDVPLHFHLHDVSRSNGMYDMRTLFDGTLSKEMPQHAIPFVDNHDTQPGQSLESWVEGWFKPQAYAILLLRSFDCPCVFAGDRDVPWLKEMMYIRKHLLSGKMEELPCDAQSLGWVCPGTSPVLVLLTIADWKQAGVCLPQFALARFVDVTDPGHVVCLDRKGQGTITCRPGSLGIYILESAFEEMRAQLTQF